MSSKRPVPRRTTRLALALASVLVLVMFSPASSVR